MIFLSFFIYTVKDLPWLREIYQNLRVQWDVLTTAHEEGWDEGKEEGKEEGLSLEEIEQL